ncbi:uncharacterized protein [Ptychodera flava]|uniref:uncharacterized protein n=1 Tax=Ptychodera flava TaxID=63121 RepID=UPI00396A6000
MAVFYSAGAFGRSIFYVVKMPVATSPTRTSTPRAQRLSYQEPRRSPICRTSDPVSPTLPTEEHCRLCGILVANTTDRNGSRRLRTSYPFFKVKKDGKPLYLRIQAILGFELIPLSANRDDRVCAGCYRTIPRIEDAMRTVENWESSVFSEYKRRRYTFNRDTRRFILEKIESFRELPPLPPPVPEPTPKKPIRKEARKPKSKQSKGSSKGSTKANSGSSKASSTAVSTDGADIDDDVFCTEVTPKNSKTSGRRKSKASRATNDVIDCPETRKLKSLLQKWDTYHKEQTKTDDVIKSYKDEISKLQTLLKEQKREYLMVEYDLRISNLKRGELRDQCHDLRRQVRLKESELKYTRDARDRLMDEIERNALFMKDKEIEARKWKEKYQFQSSDYDNAFHNLTLMETEIGAYRTLMEMAENSVALTDPENPPETESTPK